jgi:hypothetical protein
MCNSPLRIAIESIKELPVKNVMCTLAICFGMAACAVPAQDDASEATATSAETANPAKSEPTLHGEQQSTDSSGVGTSSDSSGRYCFTQCSDNKWYVNPRITANCDHYGQTEVCPNRSLVWRQAEWCNPDVTGCPSPSILL